MTTSNQLNVNAQWRLARTPELGYPQAEDFTFLDAERAEPGPDQASVRTIYLSMDPYQWVRRRSGIEQPGDACHGRTVGQVVASRHADYAEGEYIFSTNGWQSYGLVGQGVSNFGYMYPRVLDPSLAPLSTAIGVMGMLGLTAYAGLIVQCDPQPGETVVVSAASGGVGQVVGQLARICGARVVGIAGAKEKCAFVVDELGFDACVSHHSQTLAEDLAGACPDGCDVYFENVGGQVFEAVLPLLNRGSRISLCGMISQYGDDYFGKDSDSNPRKLWQQTGQAVFDRQAVQVHDLFVGNYVDEYQDQFLQEMGGYVTDGLVRYKEHRWTGLASALDAFSAMLTGGNFGKTVVAVSDE